MTTFEGSNLIEFQSTLRAMTETGNIFYESLYLNFADGYAYFRTSKLAGRAKFSFSGEMPKNFFITGQRFLDILASYPVLLLQDKVFSSESGDVFELKWLEDEFSTPSFEIEELDKKAVSFPMGEALQKALGEALAYADTNQQSGLHGIRIINQHVVASDRSRFYDRTLSGDPIPGLEIPLQIAKILWSLPRNKSVSVTVSASKIRISIEGLFEVLFPINNAIQIPDPTDPRFVTQYKHPMFVTLPYKETLDILTFIGPFTSDSASKRVCLILGQDLETVEFKVMEDNKVTRSLKAVTPFSSELAGSKLWVPQDKLKNILLTIRASGQNTLMMRVQPERPTLDFSQGDDSPLHIVLSRLNES